MLELCEASKCVVNRERAVSALCSVHLSQKLQRAFSNHTVERHWKPLTKLWTKWPHHGPSPAPQCSHFYGSVVTMITFVFIATSLSFLKNSFYNQRKVIQIKLQKSIDSRIFWKLDADPETLWVWGNVYKQKFFFIATNDVKYVGDTYSDFLDVILV